YLQNKTMKTLKINFLIVLLGKTGSAAGNTILEGNVFRSTSSSSPVTLECKKETAPFDFQKLAVVDTPGLFHTMFTLDQFNKEINRCISLAAPGPHVFLIVVNPGEFEDKEQETVRILQDVFGDKAACYTMVLFTHVDDLKVSIKQCIIETPGLSEFINQCGGKYHVFNNRIRDPAQVRELLEKINTMVKENGGSYYSNQMFRKAGKVIKKEVERLIKKENMTPKEARYKAERKNMFNRDSKVAVLIGSALGLGVGVGAGIGIPAVFTAAAAGATVGLVGGPVGAAVGATTGNQILELLSYLTVHLLIIKCILIKYIC
uniref:AIG1-type G domain-containing protein n=1 Tax=Maylandia zebra TaxID=106582 RepID=A0A3P9CFN9_9CICH